MSNPLGSAGRSAVKQTLKHVLLLGTAACLIALIYSNFNEVHGQSQKFNLGHEATELNGRKGYTVVINTDEPLPADNTIPFDYMSFWYPATSDFECRTEHADLTTEADYQAAGLDYATNWKLYRKDSPFLRVGDAGNNRYDYENTNYYDGIVLPAQNLDELDDDIQLVHCNIVSEKDGSNQVKLELLVDFDSESVSRRDGGSSASSSSTTASGSSPTNLAANQSAGKSGSSQPELSDTSTGNDLWLSLAVMLGVGASLTCLSIWRRLHRN